jgi:hypothetical protein
MSEKEEEKLPDPQASIDGNFLRNLKSAVNDVDSSLNPQSSRDRGEDP